MALRRRRRVFHNARHEGRDSPSMNLPDARRPVASRSTRLGATDWGIMIEFDLFRGPVFFHWVRFFYTRPEI